MPLSPGGTAPKWALVLLGKPQVCQDLSVEAYRADAQADAGRNAGAQGPVPRCPADRDRAQPQRRVVDGAHARRQHPLQDQRDLDRCAGANRLDAAADGQRVAADAALRRRVNSSRKQIGPLLTVVLSAAGTVAVMALGLLLLTP